MPGIFKKKQPRGFALVVTLSLMVLLTVISVGLLTLSAIALRSSAQEQALAEARANARLALMLAIGDLQKHAGPDTRVTARADILPAVADDHPPVLGVWRSWEGENHQKSGNFAGRPISPGNYEQAKKDRFLGWLTSGDPGSLKDSGAPPNADAGSNKVTLVGNGSVDSGGGNKRQQIHLSPVQLSRNSQNGAYAWWIGGENQKARLPSPAEPETDDVAGWSMHAKSHATSDPGVFRMDKLLDDATPASKAISLNQVDLLEGGSGSKVSREFFHDLSAVSTGLLTNTATGGWRKDLSVLTENWSRQPKASASLPFFRVEPGKDIRFSIPQSGGDYRSTRSLLYPWSGYRGRNVPIYEHGAVSSWENLKDWATLYKSTQSSGTAISRSSHRIDSNDPTGNFNFLHTVRRLPVIARVQWVFSYSANRINQTSYQPRLLATPVVTMWNPYNVSITGTPGLRFEIKGCMPNAFRFKVGETQNQRWHSLTRSLNHTFLADTILRFRIDSFPTLKPGQTVLFSPDPGITPQEANVELVMKAGFSNRGGHSFALKKDDGSTFSVPAATRIEAEARFDATSNDAGQNDAIGVGIYLDMLVGGSFDLAYRMIYDQAVAAAVYPPVTDLAKASVQEATSTPRPFLTTIFGARTASRTHLAAKGLVQTSPLVNYTAMGKKDIAEWNIQWDYAGSEHPVNSPFDYSFEKLAGAGGDAYPNTDSKNNGFIITGFQSSDGLSRCVLAEIPTKPIQSLAELQNWDLRYENPIPPYAFNIIGNSDATPIIPANAVVNSQAPATAVNLQHDDFYCANHLLFDDWFVSSIAPTYGSLGRPPSGATFEKTFADFASGKADLPNRAYRPLGADLALAATSAGGTELQTFIRNRDSWQTVASRIEVNGMFNVNSTSVKAWRALLGHARNQKIPYLDASSRPILSEEQDFAFTRFSIAGDTEAKTAGSSGQFSASSEFAGYRVLDEGTLDRFAEEIVKQVRQRGPFLSLAEFVNRQLSSGNLALAGTIQAALNELERGSGNPFAVVQGGSKPSAANPPGGGAAGYAFADAAVGYNAYGLPGWTRQADVLRPLAPVLSARDDTFVIRAYGDARDPTGKIITARAVCEAVVRRSRDYLDATDAADITTLPKAAANLAFGRRIEIVSFRWLAASEI